jgi:hypothetical protein
MPCTNGWHFVHLCSVAFTTIISKTLKCELNALKIERILRKVKYALTIVIAISFAQDFQNVTVDVVVRCAY